MKSVIILDRSNLRDEFKEIPLNEIDISTNHLCIGQIHLFTSTLVLFIDGDKVKVLKDRYGELRGRTISPSEAFKLLPLGHTFTWTHIKPSQSGVLVVPSIVDHFHNLEQYVGKEPS